MTRIFVYDGREFPDPDPNISPDEVKTSMSNFFPELATAETRESQRDSAADPEQKETVYEFQRRVGTKG